MGHHKLWTLLLIAALVGSLSPASFAATEGGRLLGAVRDPGGHALAGVRMVLTDKRGEHEVVSNDDGHFHLDGLAPGNYTLSIDEPGFSPVSYEPVYVRLRRVTTVRVQLSPSVDETVVVTSEPPAAQPSLATHDPQRREVPRVAPEDDPFRSTETSPATVVSAQQDTTAPPTAASSTTDLVAVDRGRSLPTRSSETSVNIYETTVSEGLDLVTRRYDRPRGELGLAWGQLPDELDGSDRSDADPETADVSLLRSTLEGGAEASGQLIPEHVWLWGSHRRQDFARRAVGGLDEDFELDTTVFELSSTLRSTSLVAAYHRAALEHRGAGAGPDRTADTLLGKNEPSALWKLEAQQLLGRGFHLTARLADASLGRFHTPLSQEADPTAAPFLGPDGVWLGTFGQLRYQGESTLWQVELERLVTRGATRHEARFGLADRQASSTAEERWGLDDTVYVAGENFGLPFDLVRAHRPSSQAVDRQHFALWAGDTLSRGRFTLDFSLRHDYQTGHNQPGSVDAHPLLPELFPGFEHAGSDAGFNWNTVLPRVASAWSLDRQGRTVLRAGWALYASRLDDDLVGRVSPGAPAELLLTFDDRDQDQRLDFDEAFDLLAGRGVDVNVPGARSSNQNPLSLDAERTHELTLGLEHAPNTRWTFQLDFVERTVQDALELRPLVRTPEGLVRTARATDYTLDTVLTGQLGDGSPYSAPVYALRSGFEATGGNVLLNGDRRRQHRQVSFGLHRRLAQRWELRGRVVWQDRRWLVGEGFASVDDPTDIALGEATDSAIPLADGNGDVASAFADGRVLDSRWAFEVLTRVRMAPHRPWGFDAALAIHGREGHPLPYRATVVGSDGQLRDVQLTPESDTYRLDDVLSADLRLEKEWALGAGDLTLTFDIFNVFDQQAVLDRDGRVDSAQTDAVRATLHPRTFRLGARWGW